MTTKQNWNTELTAQLIAAVQGIDVVSQEAQKALADQLGVTFRQVGSKLRSLVKTGELQVEVAKASAPESKWSEEETQSFADFIASNEGQYTSAEVASLFANGKWTQKQIQGKLLHMNLLGSVKATPAKESVKTYSDAEEDTIRSMRDAGKYMEEIAEALGRPLNSVRGKCLSMFKTDMPPIRDKVTKVVTDVFEGLNVSEMTVAELVEATGKSDRAIKTNLTRKSLVAKDYDGAKQAAKAAKRAEKEATAA